MKRNPSHRRKVQHKREIRNAIERRKVIHDMTICGTSVARFNAKGDVRHVPINQYLMRPLIDECKEIKKHWVTLVRHG